MSPHLIFSLLFFFNDLDIFIDSYFYRSSYFFIDLHILPVLISLLQRKSVLQDDDTEDDASINSDVDELMVRRDLTYDL